MDVFKFLDDAVRGAVSFVHGFLDSTVTLILHPIRGPARLWRAFRNPAAKQISPTTYLTLALIVASLTPMLANERERGSELGKGLATLFATGSISSEVVPTLIGVIAGTITFDAVLRILSLRLSAARRERFVGILEYCFGVFLIVLFPVGNAAQVLLGTEIGTYFVIPGLLISVFLALHFYGLLFRRRKYLVWLRRASRALRGLRRDGFVPSLGKAARRARSLGIVWFVRSYFMSAVWMLAWVVPFLILFLGLGASTETARWLSERPGGGPVLTVAGLRCGVDGDPAAARAIFWNGSEQPALGWSSALWVRQLAPGRASGGRLHWEPQLPANGRGDLVLPGDSIELTGPIYGLEPPLLGPPAPGGWPCALESDGAVRLAVIDPVPR